MLRFVFLVGILVAAGACKTPQNKNDGKLKSVVGSTCYRDGMNHLPKNMLVDQLVTLCELAPEAAPNAPITCYKSLMGIGNMSIDWLVKNCRHAAAEAPTALADCYHAGTDLPNMTIGNLLNLCQGTTPQNPLAPVNCYRDGMNHLPKNMLVDQLVRLCKVPPPSGEPAGDLERRH
jgi:hypothetical protein